MISAVQSVYTAVSTGIEKSVHSVLNALDMKKFPVEGAIFGQGHWERFDVYKKSSTYQEIEVCINKNEGKSWRSVSKELRNGGYLLRRPLQNTPSENGKVYRLVIPNGTDLDSILEQNFDSVASISKLNEEDELSPYWTFQHTCLHDKSTNLVFEGMCNNTITLRGKGAVIASATFGYALLTVAYNIVRLGVVNIYLIGVMFYQYANRKEGETFNQIARLRLKDMGVQSGMCVRNVIRTPFYALGFFFSCLYMVIDPYNGLKAAGSFEMGWNHGIPLQQAWWFFPQRDFKFEGGGAPENLGKSTFYLAGCLTPRALVIPNSQTGEYMIASLKDPNADDDEIHIKEDLKVNRVTRDWFLMFPFCCLFSFPNDY